ncbi:hypothetical protein JHK84_051594 [Glycine max]|uniref:Uncharacterized protein n=1 Tax=Glycine max TaxID=3847 RepID=K7MUZ2_SOYBN|nr:hypothetical protein JHK85_052417 [Glycine max]KAG5096006.1 hypothetical protein JHK84_051594 [Glycine max]KAH1156329.1 hypothetical protein GYH30_051229 [Glycine max]
MHKLKREKLSSPRRKMCLVNFLWVCLQNERIGFCFFVIISAGAEARVCCVGLERR